MCEFSIEALCASDDCSEIRWDLVSLCARATERHRLVCLRCVHRRFLFLCRFSNALMKSFRHTETKKVVVQLSPLARGKDSSSNVEDRNLSDDRFYSFPQLTEISMFLAGGRSATARRFSQAAINGSNAQVSWPIPQPMRHESISIMGRRRALDLYGTKDVLFTHEQVKRAKRSFGSTGAVNGYG